MEEIYILSDGSKIDLSGKSQFEKTSFLIKNPNAKKIKGGANSADVAPKNNQAQTNVTGSKSTNGSSASVTKYRLPDENDFETMQKKGLVPPPSAQENKYISDYKSLYDLKENQAKEKAYLVNTKKIKLPGSRISVPLKVKLDGSDKEMQKFVENFRDNPETGELGEGNKFKILKLKEKIQSTDSDLLNPYVYYSSKNQQQTDTFIKDNYSTKELETIGINIDDFDGYINKKGYKTDFLDKQAKGLYEGQGRNAWSNYDIGLAKELAKKKLLNMYMEDMQRRDFTRQDLNQEIEMISGFRDKKEIVRNELFNKNGIADYVEKNFPLTTQKLKDRDKENAKIYEESKKGGTDFWSWDTAGKMGKAGWNAVTDRTSQLSSTIFGAIGMDKTAEGSRMLNEENQLVRPDDRGIGYVSGKTVKYNNTNYIVDSKGEIYDADAKIRVTDLFNEDNYKKLVEESKYGPEDWTFSTQGAAVQTSGVMADMLLQAALTRGVGSFGGIASETRLALNATRPTSKFTSLINDTSQLLRKVPIERTTGYSMIAQGAMGYSQGYEATLKAARDNGINDKDAFKLATSAAQRMAVLYSTTGVINPQTKLVENVFGSKNIIKKAIEQYTKTGEKGFIKYIDDMIKSTPRNLLDFVEEGGKEVVQENVQQVGEIGVNKMTNAAAGQKIMNDVMSGDDFMNTSILSFISSGLMSKAKLPSFHAGDQSIDDLTSLSTLAKNRKEFDKIADGLLDKKVFTPDQIENLKKDVSIYANNINKLPKTITPDAAMPIMKELDKITKLTDEKQTVDKAFHPQIDEKIEGIRQNIVGIQFESDLKVKNEAIANAIKKGIVKNSSMKTFSTTAELETYLINEFDIDKKEAEGMAKRGGFMLDESNLRNYSKNPENVKPGEKMFFVNEEVAKSLDAPQVIQHEFGHGLIYETIKNDPEAQMLLGVALSKEIMKLQDASTLKGDGQTPVPKEFIERFGKYVNLYKGLIAEQDAKLELGSITKEARDAQVDRYLGNQWEEILTLYSDAISQGFVKYEEGTFSKLKDVIRQVLQYLGLKNIKFESGKDVYNFIRDYNKSVESGNWGVAMKKLGTKGATINKETLRKEVGMKAPASETKQTSSGVKYSLDNRKSSENIKKDVNKNYDKEKWSAGTNSKSENPAIDRVLFDVLSEYDYIIKGKARALRYDKLPGYTQDDSDMIAETKIALIPHIRNFNKEFFEKREEYKKELEDGGLDPKSEEFKTKVEVQDVKGYKGKKGIVKENDDLNAWINSQLVNKMGNALKSGNVTTKVFTEDIEGEGFKETRVLSDFAGDLGEESGFLDESDNIFDAEQDFEDEQNRLAVLLSDPVFRFTDEQGKPLNIETVPFGTYITEVTDPTIAANKKLKTETDPNNILDLKRQLKELERGLELQNKKDLTYDEKEELKGLKSFKSYDLSSGMMVNTFEALSVEDTPARIISDQVGREILRSPNIETLEYRNFKERLSDMSKTMARRMTFKNGQEIESFMYDNWKLLYDVINHPVDPVTGESSYASKKLPPTLKEFDDQGNLRKIKDITRIKFLQAFYEIDNVRRIIKTYGGSNANVELKQLEPSEINPQTGKFLSQNAHFDRRTALMELFGDVLVLQEARRLLRQPEFLDRVAERNVNLYNALKDDVIRAEVLKDMSKGKSDIVKFSLAETTEGEDFKEKFKKLTNTKEYIEFQDKLKKQTLYHSGSESLNRTFNNDKIKALWFYVNDNTISDWGDGQMYEAKVEDLKNTIIIPDINDIGNFHDILKKKYTKSIQQIKNNNNGTFIGDLREIIKTDQADEILSDWIKWASIKNNLSWDVGFEDIYENGEIVNGLPVIVFGYMDKKNVNKVQKDSSDIIKFSLAEEENGSLSTFLQGLPFTEQWVVARDIDNAFERAKMSTNTEIDFKVPDLVGLDDKAIAYLIISKAAEGYNNFEFFNEENSKGPLTKQVLNTIDVKSEEYKKNRDRINNIEKTINDFIETNKGVASEETYSPETAKNLGKNIGKYDIYLPPEDEDFEGLLYTLATARGKEGEMQLEFLRETLLKPYSDAMLNLMKARQTMYKDWKELINKKYKGISKELKQDSGYGGYLIDQAVRVYLWNSAPYPIPGLDKKDLFNLNEIVRTNPRLRAFAADVSLLSKQANGYTKPDSNWGFGSVVGDINNVISKSNREKYLEPWVKNIDKAFSKDNLSKIEAIYGRKYIVALNNALKRMKTGSNRSEGANDTFLNWLNGSTAVTMFFNIRSAILQTIGAINYINTTDNNILKAGAAMLNLPQYMKDVQTIWNSDYLKDRRSGLMNDVAEAELAQMMNDPRNKTVLDKFKAVNYKLLQLGYGPTRFADSLAIAFGGATFYRNRLNTYLEQGQTQDEAEKLTQRDFYQTSEQSQQSADVSKISMNQASVKGRLILAFQNTPLQYSRLIKRSIIDLAKGRGSMSNNIAKIVYYGAVQNMMFNFLQNGLFSLFWEDDEEQLQGKFDAAKFRAVSGTMDTLLRGSGLTGAMIATFKNAVIKAYEKSDDPKGYGDVLLEIANLSPSIGIKARAVAKSYKAVTYNMDEIKYKGFSLDNQYAIEAATSLTSAITNFPADRLMTKMENVSNALNEENEPWQRIFSLLGYSKYNLGIGDGSGGVDTRSNLKVPELKATELKIPVLK